ncbi:MAG: PaaI family thioesterase [Dehalococcoidia bacterium]
MAAPFDPRLYDQVCFACGARNAHGLHLHFERDGEDGVLSRYDPKPEDQGFPGVLHGGILAALLDESMAWAMWATDRALGVTAKMETRYRRPVGVEGTLTVRGRVVRMRGRRIEVEATLDDANGDRLAESSALFLRLAPDDEARMAAALGWDVIPG